MKTFRFRKLQPALLLNLTEDICNKEFSNQPSMYALLLKDFEYCMSNYESQSAHWSCALQIQRIVRVFVGHTCLIEVFDMRWPKSQSQWQRAHRNAIQFLFNRMWLWMRYLYPEICTFLEIANSYANWLQFLRDDVWKSV